MKMASIWKLLIGFVDSDSLLEACQSDAESTYLFFVDSTLKIVDKYG